MFKTKVRADDKEGFFSIETNTKSGKNTYSFQIANNARADWIEVRALFIVFALFFMRFLSYLSFTSISLTSA